MQEIPYLSTVGGLMYTQVCTHPDIAFFVRVLGRYLSDSRMQHWKAAKRVMRYLKRTKGYILTYQKSENLEIIRYWNSNFTRYQDNKHFTYGYIYMLARRAISWKFTKQVLVTSSTMVAEFVACFEASNHRIWLKLCH